MYFSLKQQGKFQAMVNGLALDKLERLLEFYHHYLSADAIEFLSLCLISTFLSFFRIARCWYCHGGSYIRTACFWGNIWLCYLWTKWSFYWREAYRASCTITSILRYECVTCWTSSDSAVCAHKCLEPGKTVSSLAFCFFFFLCVTGPLHESHV